MNKVFISHSHSGKAEESALKIADSLNEMGLNVWLDQNEIKIGDSWKDAIKKAINESSCVVALVSPHDKGNLFYQEELNTALLSGKPIFPVIINNATTEDLPDPIKDRRAINISGSNHDGLEKLYNVINGNRSLWSKVREYIINR